MLIWYSFTYSCTTFHIPFEVRQGMPQYLETSYFGRIYEILPKVKNWDNISRNKLPMHHLNQSSKKKKSEQKSSLNVVHKHRSISCTDLCICKNQVMSSGFCPCLCQKIYCILGKGSLCCPMLRWAQALSDFSQGWTGGSSDPGSGTTVNAYPFGFLWIWFSCLLT